MENYIETGEGNNPSEILASWKYPFVFGKHELKRYLGTSFFEFATHNTHQDHDNIHEGYNKGHDWFEATLGEPMFYSSAFFNTSKGMLVMNQIAGSMPICQKQVLAAEQLSLGLCRSRGFATTSARLSDDKKGDDHISLAKKVDPKEAAQEATRKALEKKKKEEKKGSEEAEKAAAKAKKEAKEKAEKEAKAKKQAEEKAAKEAKAKKEAQEKAAKKAAEEKAAKEAAEKKAAEEKAAKEAAAKKAAEEKAAKEAAAKKLLKKKQLL